MVGFGQLIASTGINAEYTRITYVHSLSFFVVIEQHTFSNWSMIVACVAPQTCGMSVCACVCVCEPRNVHRGGGGGGGFRDKLAPVVIYMAFRRLNHIFAFDSTNV